MWQQDDSNQPSDKPGVTASDLDPVTQEIASQPFWQLLDVVCSINQSISLDELCRHFLIECLQLFKADGGAVYLVRGQHHKAMLQLQALAHRGQPLSIDQKRHLPIQCWRGGQPCDERLAVKVALSRESINLDCAANSHAFDFMQEEILSVNPMYEIESVLAVPILSPNYEPVAVIQLVNAMSTDSPVTTTASVASVKVFTELQQYMLETLCQLVSLTVISQVNATEQRGLLVRLSAEPTLDKLFDRILWEAQVITGAEGGTFYLVNTEEANHPTLEFKVFHNYALNTQDFFINKTTTKQRAAPIAMLLPNGKPNYNNVVSFAANAKQTVNIADAYATNQFDFSGTKAFDAAQGYRSVSFLTVPLMNHQDEVIGVLQLINARDPISKQIAAFSRHHEAVVQAMASYAATALNNQLLVVEHKKLLDAFVKCLAKAIDAKSKHTAEHCQRVPVLTEMLAKACCDDKEVLPEFSLNEDEWYELHVAGWLHDCGKLGTPDHILNKSTKLEIIRDTIEEVQLRLEMVKLGQKVEAVRVRCTTPWQALSVACQYYKFAMMINDEKSFLSRVNIGNESMLAEDQERVCRIAERVWYDESGQASPVLTEAEVEFLCIRKGTLSMAERKRMNDHIVLTVDMLESLPFPAKLKRVPEYAGGHHEKIDGTGYPKGLTGDQLSLPAKMMAIADIFEALTAVDRPYKKPMKLSKALMILKQLRDNRHIDPQIYQVFLTGAVWKQYAEAFLSPEQLDVEDFQVYL